MKDVIKAIIAEEEERERERKLQEELELLAEAAAMAAEKKKEEEVEQFIAQELTNLEEKASKKDGVEGVLGTVDLHRVMGVGKKALNSKFLAVLKNKTQKAKEAGTVTKKKDHTQCNAAEIRYRIQSPFKDTVDFRVEWLISNCWENYIRIASTCKAFWRIRY